MLQWLKNENEMYEYTSSHGFGKGIGSGWGVRNFKFLRSQLQKDEKPFVTFIGLHNFRSMSCHQRNFVYAITDHRIIMGQVRSFWRTRFSAVALNEIKSIGIDNNSTVGVLKINLENDTLAVGMHSTAATALGQELSALLPEIQRMAHALEPQDANNHEEESTTVEQNK